MMNDKLNNLFQLCLYFTIGLIVFTLCINFFSMLGVFGNIAGEMGTDIDGNSSDIMKQFSKSEEYTSGLDITNIWLWVIGGEVAAGIALAIITQDATFVGIFIFSAVFWTSYVNAMAIVSLSGIIPIALIGLFTIPIFFIFIGAVVGMLSGV